MSATDQGGVTDGVAVAVNDEPWTDRDPTAFDQRHLEDCKGPDSAQWDNPEARDEPAFDEGVDAVKGPGPEWDDGFAVEG